MKIISLLNEKGGVGKSTLATNIATALHRQNKRVVLIDADSQGTAHDWRRASENETDLPPVISIVEREKLESLIATLDADIVIIDSPAGSSRIAGTIVRLSDVVLLVIQPSGPDVWASSVAVKLIYSRRANGGKLDAAFLINRASANTRLSKLIKGGGWNDYVGIDQFETTIGNRIAFAQAMTDGVSVFELSDELAKNEVNKVIEELEAAKWL